MEKINVHATALAIFFIAIMLMIGLGTTTTGTITLQNKRLKHYTTTPSFFFFNSMIF
jgi:hypothetical protein